MKSTIVPLLASVTFVAAQNPFADFLSSQPDLSTLAGALSAAPDLVQTLLTSGYNLTVLAPTNDAFSAVSSDSLAGVAIANGDTGSIAAILSYHVLNGTYKAAVATETPKFIGSLLNASFTFDGTPATNVTPDQNVGFVKQGDDVQIISGELNTSNVTEADLTVGGIVVHKIDSVLTLPVPISTTATDIGLTAALGAIFEANLASTLDNAKDITIFVPSNEAFQAVGSAFESASVETLASILEYHVIGSVVFSTDLTDNVVPSYGGNLLRFTVKNGTAFVNGAKIITPNVITANGVAHVIDGVLNPAGGSIDTAALEPNGLPLEAFPGASSVSTVPFISALPPSATVRSMATASSGGISIFDSMSTSVGSAAVSGPVTLSTSFSVSSADFITTAKFSGQSAVRSSTTTTSAEAYTGAAAPTAAAMGGVMAAAVAFGGVLLA